MGMRPGLRPASREACAVLAFGGNLETRASAQTSKFLVPKSSALPARRPYWGAYPSHRLCREYWGFGLEIFQGPVLCFLLIQSRANRLRLCVQRV
jgi:hypothetical protein